MPKKLLNDFEIELMGDDSFKLFMYDDLNYYSMAETLAYRKFPDKAH